MFSNFQKLYSNIIQETYNHIYAYSDMNKNIDDNI